MHDTDKIQRQVHFMSAIPYDAENKTGSQNTWNYNRAPEGYKFLLHSVTMSCDLQNTTYEGLVAMFDGHEYTHWNLWPGVESREMLLRAVFNAYMLDRDFSLNLWECKEYSLGCRSRNSSYSFKVAIVVWYYLKKMSWLEKLYYAVIQPKGDRYKKTLGVTVEPTELE